MEPNNLNENNQKKQFKINFSKMHGAGNDFVVFKIQDVERLDKTNQSPVTIEEISKVTTKISNRKLGIGCDQLIVVDGEPTEPNSHYGMHVVNCDGRIEMMCGNGIRCATKYIIDNNIKPKIQYNNDGGKEYFNIETKSGVIKTLALVDHELNDKSEQKLMVKVNMGKPKFVQTILNQFKNEDESIIVKSNPPPKESFVLTIDGLGFPYCDKVEGSLISCGGAHFIVDLTRNIELGYFSKQYANNLNTMEIKNLSEKIMESPLFYGDTVPNVEFIYQSNQDKLLNRLQSRVVERGSGETLACGTGATAVGVASTLLGLVDDKKDIMVSMPGGDLLINWSIETNETFKTGPSVTVFNSQIYV